MSDLVEWLEPFMPYLVKYGLPIFIAIAVLGALTKAIVRPLKRQKAIEEAAQLLGLTCVDEPTPELADLLDSVFLSVQSCGRMDSKSSES